MKRVYIELRTCVGKPLLIQRYEYHLSEEDSYALVVQRIRDEHGYNVPISCGQARILEVVYIKEISSPAVSQELDEEDFNYQEEDEYNYGLSKKNRHKRKRRI